MVRWVLLSSQQLGLVSQTGDVGIRYCGFSDQTDGTEICSCGAELAATDTIQIGRKTLNWLDEDSTQDDFFCLTPDELFNRFTDQDYLLQVQCWGTSFLL